MLLETLDRDTSIKGAVREGRELVTLSQEHLERLAEAYNETLTVAVDRFNNRVEGCKATLDLLTRTDLELMLDELAELAQEIADQTARVYFLAGYLAGLEA